MMSLVDDDVQFMGRGQEFFGDAKFDANSNEDLMEVVENGSARPLVGLTEQNSSRKGDWKAIIKNEPSLVSGRVTNKDNGLSS